VCYAINDLNGMVYSVEILKPPDSCFACHESISISRPMEISILASLFLCNGTPIFQNYLIIWFNNDKIFFFSGKILWSDKHTFFNENIISNISLFRRESSSPWTFKLSLTRSFSKSNKFFFPLQVRNRESSLY